MFDWLKKLFSKDSNQVRIEKRVISDYEFNDMRKKREDKMNSILEKISKKGYDSLSKHEKIFLDNYKNNL
jgi:Txe/YoeB family toxin of Txe-Axe toxin-antitoxin module